MIFVSWKNIALPKHLWMKGFYNYAKYTSLTKNVMSYISPILFWTNTFVVIKEIMSSGNVMSRSLVEIYEYIRQTYCFYTQSTRISFYTGDGSSKFLQNTSKCYKCYITWWNSSDDSNLLNQYHQSLKSHIVTDTSHCTFKARINVTLLHVHISYTIEGSMKINYSSWHKLCTTEDLYWK